MSEPRSKLSEEMMRIVAGIMLFLMIAGFTVLLDGWDIPGIIWIYRLYRVIVVGFILYAVYIFARGRAFAD